MSQIKIGKLFEFEAAHQLPDEEIYGNCSRMHGHSYKLAIEIEGKCSQAGMVMNFKDLKAIVNKLIINVYDHSNLNDFFALPTAEVMVLHFFDILRMALPKSIQLRKVELWETSGSYAKIER